MKSLDKKKAKELDFNDKLYDIWFESLCNGNYQMFQKKIKEMFTQQRTEILEEILNLECLKEESESGWKGNSFDNTGNGNKSVRNNLRKEIKEEIKKL